MSELNEPQKQAVLHATGPLLIFAGAGSGKTRTITYRIANLLAEHRVPPYRILAVTFTNKAAGEMRSRLERLAGPEVTRDLWIGTFHSVCARLLRRYSEAAGLEPRFVIYDDNDQKTLITRILKQRGLEQQVAPRYVLARIHAEKREARGPDEAQFGDYQIHDLREIYAAYERALRESNAVDFEDLIVRGMRLAEDPESPIAEQLRSRYLHVLVDEFQDTNLTQYRLVRALSARERNLCVVGDDDQSIYRWRGADVRLIRGFRRDFPDAAVIKLEQNYRSTANIVSAALGVIAPSRDRIAKELWTAEPRGDKVVVRSVEDERQEAEFVVRMLQREIRQGTDRKDIAIFYRVHAQSRVIEEALRNQNVPYQVIGGMKFFERAEIKDVLAYLRLVENPKSNADLMRVINVPARGIGAKSVESIMDVAAERGLSAYDAIVPTLEYADISSALRKRLLAFSELIRGLQAELTHLSVRELAEQVLERSGYLASLRNDKSVEAEGRLGNVQELLGSIEEYEQEAPREGETASLGGYLERVSLVSAVDTMQDVSMVSLMTVHSAKGLEFDAVLLTGMEEDIFPYRRMDAGEAEDVDEERRLAYVAITRARKRLYITHAKQRMLFGRTHYLEPSRFLRDLPPDVVVNEGVSSGVRRPVSPSWASPVSSKPSYRPGERVVDTTAFDDIAFSPGSRVMHKQFGEGIVERIEFGAAPIVVASFGDHGVRRIHARFLELA